MNIYNKTIAKCINDLQNVVNNIRIQSYSKAGSYLNKYNVTIMQEEIEDNPI